MTLEQQVTSLELSKRLKELGVKQESLFSWFESSKYPEWNDIRLSVWLDRNQPETKPTCSAFTASELGEMLPQVVYKNGEDFGILFSTSDCSFANNKGFPDKEWKKKYKVWYEYLMDDEVVIGFSEENEANARAKMLIYLLENNLITKP